MAHIILSIITIIFSILFLIWGIYQIKTGKMVAKKAKNPIDEPREVGALFIGISIASFITALSLGTDNLVKIGLISESVVKTIGVFCITLFALLLSTAIFFFTKSLLFHRIFGLKSDKLLDKIVKKFYLPVDLSIIIFFLFLGISIIGNAFFSLGIFAGVLGLLSILAFFVYASLMTTISLKYKKLSKSRKSKSRKSPKKI